MNEHAPQSAEKFASFTFPDLEHERGEIRRVAEKFIVPEDRNAFVEAFIGHARQGSFDAITEEKWAKLDNTDSYDIARGDWVTVQAHCESQDVPRNWEMLKDRLEEGGLVYAPIILKMGDTLHLVSGNTRLMVARALGERPVALTIDMTDAGFRSLS